MEEKKLIGFHKFHSNKKNQDYLVADCVCATTARDRQNGYVGTDKVEQIFIPDNLFHIFEDAGEKIIGKTLQFEYSISGRYFNLVNITVKN